MAHLIGLKVAETKEKNSLGFVGQNLKRKHAVKSWGEYVPKPNPIGMLMTNIPR